MALSPGLSYRSSDGFRHNPDRPISSLEGTEIRPPRRDVRALQGYTMLGRQVDVVETSRGCTFDCSFCSIIEMRGRNFFTYDMSRVIADIRDAHNKGARAIFLVDDNITLNIARFEMLCNAIVDAKLNHIDYIVQAMTSSIANHGEKLAPLMRRAGFPIHLSRASKTFLIRILDFCGRARKTKNAAEVRSWETRR
jgi:radical SAM superfamily enzyme YgiQ (UPF0313 family)